MLPRFTADMSVLCVLECSVSLHHMTGLYPAQESYYQCYRHWIHVSCPPGFELFKVRSEVLRLPNLHHKKTLEFLVPGSFEFVCYTLCVTTSFIGPRTSGNTIHDRKTA
jgi:hypothetical protein